ncbi:MAG: TonB-dependent receptor [Bacteroidetes bacterium]|nr:MAG: TonB-dependent receptor [Bacteroidota bacterium]
MKKNLQMLAVCMLMAICSWAQTQKISGRVVSAASNTGADGISVVVKGTSRGTITSPIGEFTIAAKTGEVLVISGIGFVKQEVTVTLDKLEVLLQSDAGNLSDVVVVGYGTQRRASLTGAQVQLNNAAITKRQVSSASQVIQGLAPGVTVQQQSGRPGADGASIRIRGESSILGNSNPLVVIDGLQMPNTSGLDAFNQLDPNAIESVTLLKDAASTAIYGNRGSAGVLIVKTKRAQKAGLKLSYNNFFSGQDFTSIPQRVSAVDHMELSNVAERNRTGNPAATVFPQTLIDRYRTVAADNLEIIDTDWQKEVFTNSGLMQNHNVQLVSGGDRVNVFSSITYFNQRGLIQNSQLERYDLRLNPEFKISDKLTLSGNLGYNNSTTTNPSTGSPEFIIRQAIGLPAIGAGKFGPGLYGTAGQSNNRNPIAMAEAAGTSVTEGNTLITRVALNYRPIKGLELEGSWAREKRNPYSKSFIKNVDIYQPNLTTRQYDLIGNWPGNTSLSESWRNDIYQSWLGQATYQFRIKEDHSIKILAGAQSELTTNYFFGASRQGFNNPNQPYLNLGTGARDNNSGISELALAGFYGRLNYAFKDRYYLELNGRRDGSSRFSQARNKQWGNFAAASAGWIFTKENFFKGLNKAISYGKLRGSFGANGNQNIGNDFYVFDAFYEQAVYNNPVNGTNAYFNNTTNLGLALLQFPNPELSWETSKQWNVGLDLTFLTNFTLTADYYVRELDNMILRRTLPASAGGLGNPFVNAGNMDNKGWEFSLNYRKKFGKLTVDVTGMLSDVVNNVTGLTAGLPFIGDGIRTAPGQALNSYFGYRSLGFFADSNDVKNSPVQFGIPWSASPTVGPKPGDTKYADISGPDGKPDGRVDNFDREFLGNAFPRYEYSINLNLGYAGFDLNIFGQGVGKRDNFLSGTGAVPFASADFAASLLDIHKDYWRPDNQGATFPRLLPSGFGGNNFLLSDQWIRSAAYFRIKNINLGYTLPANLLKKLRIETLRVFVSGQNLFTATSAWNGFDPEINNANAEFYPVQRTYTAGLNVTF